MDLHSHKDNLLTKCLSTNGFIQVVEKATHLGGGLIDHCYVRISGSGSYSLELLPVVYSDHDAVCFSYKNKHITLCNFTMHTLMFKIAFKVFYFF